LKYKI